MVSTPRNPCNYVNYYSFADPGGMEDNHSLGKKCCLMLHVINNVPFILSRQFVVVCLCVIESSRPVRCPFYGAFRFRYDDLLSGFCDGTVSYAQPCVGHSRYQLSFRHCVDSAVFNRHSIYSSLFARNGSIA